MNLAAAAYEADKNMDWKLAANLYRQLVNGLTAQIETSGIKSEMAERQLAKYQEILDSYEGFI